MKIYTVQDKIAIFQPAKFLKSIAAVLLYEKFNCNQQEFTMDLVTSEMQGYLANSSAIRKMFEAGIELRKRYSVKNLLKKKVKEAE